MAERCMKVKGTGVMATKGFVKEKFPDRFDEWLDALPPESREIHGGTILATQSYLIYDALVVPTEKLCELFYNGDEYGAWIAGIHSAGFALNSFYKVFFKVGSPQFIIKRASSVFSSYYPDGEMHVADTSDRQVVLQVTKFSEPHYIIELGIGGWMEGALELMGCRNISVDMTKSMANGDSLTEFVAKWE